MEAQAFTENPRVRRVVDESLIPAFEAERNRDREPGPTAPTPVS